MFAEPEFWVAVAFVILMGVFAYFGIHRTVLKTLDHRSDRIKAELDDARPSRTRRPRCWPNTSPATPAPNASRRTSSRPQKPKPSASRPKPRPIWKILSPGAPRPQSK